jgi:hypothetical protein
MTKRKTTAGENESESVKRIHDNPIDDLVIIARLSGEQELSLKPIARRRDAAPAWTILSSKGGTPSISGREEKLSAHEKMAFREALGSARKNAGRLLDGVFPPDKAREIGLSIRFEAGNDAGLVVLIGDEMLCAAKTAKGKGLERRQPWKERLNDRETKALLRKVENVLRIAALPDVPLRPDDRRTGRNAEAVGSVRIKPANEKFGGDVRFAISYPRSEKTSAEDDRAIAAAFVAIHARAAGLGADDIEVIDVRLMKSDGTPIPAFPNGRLDARAIAAAIKLMADAETKNARKSTEPTK